MLNNKNIREFYERESLAWVNPSYRNLKRIHAKYAAGHLILMLGKSCNAQSILDFGCGAAFSLSLISKTFNIKKQVGIDISSRMLKLAKDNLPGAKLILGSEGHLKKFKDKEFDLVILIDIIEHLLSPEKFLKEISRVGKTVVIKIPLEKTWFTMLLRRLSIIPATPRRINRGHLREYSREDFHLLLQKTGFRIISELVAFPPREIAFHPSAFEKIQQGDNKYLSIYRIINKILRLIPYGLSSYLLSIKNGHDYFVVCQPTGKSNIPEIDKFLDGYWQKKRQPILRPGSKGEWDDNVVGTPRVFKKGASYYLFYTGQSQSKRTWGIGLARSKNLYDWFKYTNNPILTGTAGEWDERIDGVNIIKHKGLYYLFYEASGSATATQNIFVKLLPVYSRRLLGRLLRELTSPFNSLGVEHANKRAIGFAFSKDLVRWQKYKSNPVLKPICNGWESKGVYSPFVEKIGSKFYMTYSGSDGKCVCSGVASSENLISWQREVNNPILRPGLPGAWDARVVNITSYFKIGRIYYAFYEGEDNKNIYRIGIAYSRDFKAWVKNNYNPILDIGSEGAFDERMACGPQIFTEGGNYYLFYVGHDNNMIGYSGLAKLKGL
jgi:predicted GH43/DUF377 family glycosyl hydrolase